MSAVADVDTMAAVKRAKDKALVRYRGCVETVL
jgi:hypothetical protein